MKKSEHNVSDSHLRHHCGEILFFDWCIIVKRLQKRYYRRQRQRHLHQQPNGLASTAPIVRSPPHQKHQTTPTVSPHITRARSSDQSYYAASPPQHLPLSNPASPPPTVIIQPHNDDDAPAGLTRRSHTAPSSILQRMQK